MPLTVRKVQGISKIKTIDESDLVQHSHQFGDGTQEQSDTKYRQMQSIRNRTSLPSVLKGGLTNPTSQEMLHHVSGPGNPSSKLPQIRAKETAIKKASGIFRQRNRSVDPRFGKMQWQK